MTAFRVANWPSVWNRQLDRAQFHFRQQLAKLPYIPVRLKLRMSLREEIKLRWSYIVPFQDRSRHFFDYWGHDMPELRFLWRALTPGMTFFDVGSFHGIYALVAAKRLGHRGQVVAFEPSPSERRRLELHVRMNGFRSVHVESCAVGAINRESDFFAVRRGDATRGGLRPPVSSERTKRLAVRVMSLDQYLLNGPVHNVHVMKLDVEGGELDVFRGAMRTLTELRPLIICEVFDPATRAWGYEAKEIVATLERHDFAWFEFNQDGTVMPHQAKAQYPDVRNYLAIPREKCQSGAASFS
jgi:FkbM family methyltransferase